MGKKGSGPSALSSTRGPRPAARGAQRRRGRGQNPAQVRVPYPPPAPPWAARKAASELRSPPGPLRKGRGLGRERRSEGNK